MTPQRTPFEQQLAEDGRVLSSLSWLRQSGFTADVADERMVIRGAGGVVCAYCYTADEVVAFARRQSPARGAGMAGPVADPARPSGARVRDLEETIRYLRERWHATVAERDEWEHRARAAEKAAETLRGARPDAPGAEAKYASLRRFLARELHPDNAPADNGPTDGARAIRAELFKLVWAEIARLDKG